MKSSYQERNISNRNLLPNGNTSVDPPPINSDYPLGCFEEDYEYVANSGDLDEHNGRTCVTPDYPNGTYAYFISLDDTLGPDYPFMVGLTYHGEKWWTGAEPTATSLPGNAVEYTGTVIALADFLEAKDLAVFPNPSIGPVMVRSTMEGDKEIRVIDLNGRVVFQTTTTLETSSLQLSQLTAGVYLIEVKQSETGLRAQEKWIKR